MADVAIEVFALTKTFKKGKRRTRALNDACLCVNEGEMVALIGASGSGKSTLIRHMIGLTTGDAGAGPCCVTVLGKPVQDHGRMSSGVRAVRAEVGVIFQQFNLVGRLSLLTNVLLGLLGHISAWRGSLGLFTDGERRLAMEALHRVGMHEYAGQRASTLSGGQQQRAAIARALVQQASVILADEPIASLDPESARRVMENLARINREDGTTVVVSLHQVDFAIRYCPRTVAMRDGRIIYDGPSKALTPEFLRDLYGADSKDLILAGPLGSKAFGEDQSAPVFAVAEAVG